MEQFKPPQSLSLEGNLSENWRKWEQRFQLYLKASGAEKKSDETKVAILLHCVGEEALEVHNTFIYDGDDGKKPEKVIEQFKAYCNPRKNIVFERYKFWERSQHEGENIKGKTLTSM